MSDKRELAVVLEPVLEGMQQCVLSEKMPEELGELQRDLDVAIEEVRFLYRDDVLETLETTAALLRGPSASPEELLPLIFALQDAVPAVSIDLASSAGELTGATPESRAEFVDWDINADLEAVTRLDSHSQFLLDGAVSRGLQPYMVRVYLRRQVDRVEEIVALLEKHVSLVNCVSNRERGRVSALLVSGQEPPIERFLAECDDALREAVSFETRVLSDAEITGSRSSPVPGRNRSPDLQVTLPSVALDRMRFLLARLQATVSTTDQTLVRELSGTLESVVSIRIRDLVRDLNAPLERRAAELQKPVLISFGGTADRIPAEKSVLIREALTEILDNAVKHGIEPPAERRAQGKDEQGVVRVFAGVEGDTLTLRVTDDGRGIPEERLQAITAGESGLATIAKRIRTCSGGSLNLKSGPRGTTVTITMALTAGSWNALLGFRYGKPFVIPLVLVAAVEHIAAGSIVQDVSGGTFLRHRERLLILGDVHRAEVAGADGVPVVRDPTIAVVLAMHTGEFALALDSHPEEVSVVPDGPGTASVPDQNLKNVLVALQPPAEASPSAS